MCKKLLIFLSLVYVNVICAQNITLNQLGFYTGSYKVAIVPASVSGNFQVINSSNTAVYTGTLGSSIYWKPADANVKIADFSSFTTPGTYTVKAGSEVSYSFEITDSLLNVPTKTMLRGYYYWRSSQAISNPYSVHQGIDYARSLGHADNSVQIDGSAAYGTRTSGSKISCAKGWYDAGDYGKYVVTGAVSAYYLMMALEQYPQFATTINSNIPESSNSVPDILDEAKWELDWLLNMQDPQDGGVYFQLTTQSFADWVQPSADGAQRYVYKKTTPSTLDFAAVMAVAYRVFKNYSTQFPGYADQCLAAAKKAWTWAQTNSSIHFSLAGGTGNYEDDNGSKSFNDEKAWASNELYIATADATYYNATDFLNDNYCYLEEPSWQKTSGLGLLSLVNNLSNLNSLTSTQKDAIKNKFLNFADSLADIWDASGYKIMTNRHWWGINSIVATQGLFFLDAYRMTSEDRYLNAAVSHMDYVFGRNPTRYSYVTWLGDKTPQNPHDRRSASDGISKPIPGYMVGGACNNDCIDCAGAGKSYADDQTNYTYNEIAINWNAPVVYLMCGVANTFLFKGAYFTNAIIQTDSKHLQVSVSNALKSASVTSSTASSFLVKVGVNDIQVTDLSLDATSKMLTLTLASDITPTDSNITVSYNGNSILAKDNNPLLVFNQKPVVNKLPGGPLKILSVSCSSDGKTITFVVDKQLASVPAPAGGFSVLINGYDRTISAITIDATDKTKLNLTLSNAVVGGDGINVSYSGSSNVIASDGGILLPFIATIVKNPVVVTTTSKGFCDDFNDNVIGSYLSMASPLTISESGGSMTVNCNGQSGYSQLSSVIDPIDISSNPKIVFKLQVSSNVTMRVDIGSYDGTQYVYTNTDPVSVSVKGSSSYQTVTFNYSNWSSSYPSGTVDPKKISKIVVSFNPGSGFNGSVLIDNITVAECSPSNDATLSSLTINGNNILSPSFNKAIYTYTVTLPSGTTMVPTVSAVASNATATVAITQAENLNGTATVVVTAAGGAKKQYLVKFVSNLSTQAITLQQGWNLVSFYITPQQASIDSVFNSIKSSLITIKSSTGFYRPSQNAVFNSLTSINNNDGYLINVSSQVSFLITGVLATNSSTNLKSGWNLVAYPKDVKKTITSVLTGIASNFIMIKNFDAFYQPTESINGLTEFEPGKGYLIKTNSACNIVW